MDIIRVLVADDHKVFRDGIQALLEKIKDIKVVGEAADGNEAIEKLSKGGINVVLMDIDMGATNGIDTTIKIRDLFPDVKILVLSMHGEHSYIIRMLDAGATGYMLKNAGKDEMVTAIRSVAKGDSYFSREVSSILVEHLHKPTSVKKRKDNLPLTDREIEVLKLIAHENSNPEIAEKLFISIRTVDTHRRNLLEKLGAKNTAGLVKYAIRNGLVDS